MFSFSRSKPGLIALFDIGSSSVRGGLVSIKKGKAPHIEFTTRERIPLSVDLSPKRLFSGMIDALNRANTSMIKATNGKRVNQVVYAFSSPWSATQTKVVTIEKTKPFILTKKIIDDVIDDAEKKFEEESIGKTNDGTGDKLVTMERRIIQVNLNGHGVESPYEKKSNRADISFFTSIIPRSVLDKVSDTSLIAYHQKDPHLFSFPLIAFSLLRDTYKDVHDFVFLDIGGELTDVSIIKDDLIVETGSFPLGMNFLVRKVSKELSMSPGQAESILGLSFSKHGDSAINEKLAPIIESASEEWAHSLHTFLLNLSHVMSLSQNLFLTVDSEFTRFFVESIKTEKVTDLGLENTPFSITVLSPEKFNDLVSFGPHINRDPLITMIAAFLHSQGMLE